MKLCAAQTRPAAGDIAQNIVCHRRFIELAAAQDTDLIVFPELSLTGYEPRLAANLAMSSNDRRLDGFQELADRKEIMVAVGIPVRSDQGIQIGFVLFRPGQERLVYSKQHLHPDEEPFFVKGSGLRSLDFQDSRIAFAICYELSVPSHCARAVQDKANIYFASAAKSAQGVVMASARLASIAATHSMIAMLCNSVGPSDNFLGGGGSSVWNGDGVLLDRLDNTEEGLLIFDSTTHQFNKITLQGSR